MIAGSDFVRYLLSAGGVVTCLAAAAVWLAWSRNSASARRFLFGAVLFFVICSLYGPQYLLALAIARSSAPFVAADASPQRRTALVVLGSGSVDVEGWDGATFSFVDQAAAARVLEAVRVFRMIDPPLVISSGGNPHPGRREKPTAETMRDAMLVLGIPADRIVIESTSKTTRDEATIVAGMLRAHGVEQTILVTSQTHMARALGAFRAVGVPAIPAVAQEFEPDVPLAQFVLPTDDGLWVASKNAHEVLGLTYYWLRGWWIARAPAGSSR